MRVFLTGATGFLGSAIAAELKKAGHEVLALARSEHSERQLLNSGFRVQRGSLEDVESLRRGVTSTDAVIHAAFDHDFSKFAETCEIDRLAIKAMGEALLGTEKYFVVTAGLPVVNGRVATEDDPPEGAAASPRQSEQMALELVKLGVRASIIRMSQIHDRTKQGFASYLLPLAREKGVSAYPGNGSNYWAGIHRLDAARLYLLALEKNESGARYHAVADEALPMRRIAEVIGERLNVPIASIPLEEAPAHFGWLARIAGMDAPASNLVTCRKLGWQPTQSTFLDSLLAGLV